MINNDYNNFTNIIMTYDQTYQTVVTNSTFLGILSVTSPSFCGSVKLLTVTELL